MAAIVTCRTCKKKFDRNKENFSIKSPRIYYCEDCGLKKLYPIYNPHEVYQCYHCLLPVKRDEAIKLNEGRYAHKNCREDFLKKPLSEKEELIEYILQKHKLDALPARILKQIKDYIEINKFTYSGIKKTLEYYYDIKGNSVYKNGHTIAIVGYIYQQAYNFYYKKFLAEQKNNQKEISKLAITQQETIVSSAVFEKKKKNKKRKSILDEE